MPTLEATLASSLVAGLGVSGWLSARARRQIERDCPPLGQFVEAAGCRLHYVDKGSGEANLVLIHGASANLRDLAYSILDPLAERHRVLAFDRPGYGYSTRSRRYLDPSEQASCLREALHALGIARPILVAHSWAGSLALAYALAFPDDLRGLALLSPASHPWPGGVALYRTLGATPLLGPLLASTLIWPLGRRGVDDGIRSALAPIEPPPDYRRRAGIDLLLRPSQFLADAQDVSRLCPFLTRQSRRYAELGVPLTIVTGTRDSIVSPELHAHALHAQVPHSKLRVIEGAGHAPHHSHPDDVLDAIHTLVSTTR